MGDQLVQRLTDANWEKRVGESDWIVEFYAPWYNAVDIISTRITSLASTNTITAVT